MRRILALVALLGLGVAGSATVAPLAGAQTTTIRGIVVSPSSGLSEPEAAVRVSSTDPPDWPANLAVTVIQCSGLAAPACDQDVSTTTTTGDDGAFGIDLGVRRNITPSTGPADCTEITCYVVVADTTVTNVGYAAISFGEGPVPAPPGEEPDFGTGVVETDVPPPGPCPALADADTSEKSETAVGDETHKLIGVTFSTNGCEDSFVVRYSRTGDNEVGWRARYLDPPSIDAPARLELRTDATTDPVYGGNASATIPGLTYLQGIQEQSPGDGSLVGVLSVRAGAPFRITERGGNTFIELRLELGPVVTGAAEPLGTAPTCRIPGADTAGKLSEPSPTATRPAVLQGVDTIRRGCADRVTFRYKATGGAPSYRVEYVAASRATPKATPLVSGPLASLVAGSGVPEAVSGPVFLRVTANPASARAVSTGSRLPTGKLRFVRSITKSGEADGAVDALVELDAVQPFRVLERSVANGFALSIEVGTVSQGFPASAIPGLDAAGLSQQATQQGFSLAPPDLSAITSLGGPLAALARGKITNVTINAAPSAATFGAPGDVTLGVEARMQVRSGEVRGAVYGLTCKATTARTPSPADATGLLGWCAARPYTGAKPDAAAAWVASALPNVTAEGGYSRVIGGSWLTVSALTDGSRVIGYQLRLTGLG